MRTNLDFTPFYRSSIGFDRLFNLLEEADRLGSTSSGPAHDIARNGDDAYAITIAVPGFAMNDLDITQQPNLLIVTGKADDKQGDYLHRGIDRRSFALRFELADYVEVVGASLSDGLLRIEMQRRLPEAMKPRRIDIGRAGATAPQKQIESPKAA
jgi:molecular chaperone IbpA